MLDKQIIRSGNPLKERDETLAVLDSWGDASDRRRMGGFARWLVAALVLAGCFLGALAAFPSVVQRVMSL